MYERPGCFLLSKVAENVESTEEEVFALSCKCVEKQRAQNFLARTASIFSRERTENLFTEENQQTVNISYLLSTTSLTSLTLQTFTVIQICSTFETPPKVQLCYHTGITPAGMFGFSHLHCEKKEKKAGLRSCLQQIDLVTSF